MLSCLDEVAVNSRLAECFHRLQAMQPLHQDKAIAIRPNLDRRRLAVLKDALGDLTDLAASSVFVRFTGTWISAIWSAASPTHTRLSQSPRDKRSCRECIGNGGAGSGVVEDAPALAAFSGPTCKKLGYGMRVFVAVG